MGIGVFSIEEAILMVLWFEGKDVSAVEDVVRLREYSSALQGSKTWKSGRRAEMERWGSVEDQGVKGQSQRQLTTYFLIRIFDSFKTK